MAADLAGVLPPVTFIPSWRYRRTFKSCCAALSFKNVLCVSPRAPSFFFYIFLFRSLLCLSSFFFPALRKNQPILLYTRQNGHRDNFHCNRRFHDQGRSSDNFEKYIPNFSKLSDDRPWSWNRRLQWKLSRCPFCPIFQSCLMIDLGRETDGYNENCLGVRFALCIIKALRLARIEHCSGTVVTPFLPSYTIGKICLFCSYLLHLSSISLLDNAHT